MTPATDAKWWVTFGTTKTITFARIITGAKHASGYWPSVSYHQPNPEQLERFLDWRECQKLLHIRGPAVHLIYNESPFDSLESAAEVLRDERPSWRMGKHQSGRRGGRHQGQSSYGDHPDVRFPALPASRGSHRNEGSRI